MAKKGRLEQIIVNRDIYGHNIGVHYRGSDSFKTRLGAFVTLITYLLISFNFERLLVAFKDGSKQEEKNQSI